MSVAVIIAAAGQGRRMKSAINKQYLNLSGRPVIAHTLSACIAADCFTQIIVVVAPGEEEIFRRDVVFPWFPARKFFLVPGGKERQDSVREGLAVLANNIEYVCIHEGARPLVQPSLFRRCLTVAREKGGAIAAVAVKDTIKMANPQGEVIKTLPRHKLWAVQTPQIFRRDWLELAYRRAYQEGIQATDDAALLEAAGYPIQIVSADYENIKITTPEDLLLAEAILRRRQDENRHRL